MRKPPCARFPFSLSSIEKNVPHDCLGVYGFWFHKYCIYIGKAERQTVRERLVQHWGASHNPSLSEWIRAKRHELYFSVLCVEDPSVIFLIERECVRKLQPLVNIIRYME